MPKPDLQLAFDRSMRRIDVDGRMHVELSNISKANVCGYYGHEIPGAAAAGMQLNKMYKLYRDPEELKIAADTFNNIPLLSRHVKVSADDPQSKFVVGATGSNAQFDGQFLKNSIVIWDQIAIDGVETKEQCELSSAYRYTVDWTPGVIDGVAYDGRMTNIIGNHVALVSVGRAGPDVVVGDENPFSTSEYKTMKASRKAVAIRAALGVFLRPQLAMDAQAVDLGALVRGVKSATIAQDMARIVKDVATKIPDVDQTALADTLRIAADAEPDDDEDDVTDPPPAAKPAVKADDETKPMGMDAAAVAALVATTQTETMQRMNAIRQAEIDVKPLVGEVIGMDSAEAVYGIALKAAGIATDGVHPSAFKALVDMHKTQIAAATATPAPVVALDAAGAQSFAERFPTAAPLKRS